MAGGFAQTASGKRLALVVGIDKYQQPTVRPLHGAEKDARAIRELLIQKFEFDAADVQLLINQDATRAGIISGLDQLVRRTSADDEVVFYYAGHGSRAPLPGNASGQEDTIVPVDSRDPAGKVFDILASELQAKVDLLKAKTNRITVILDSCHSGTAVRGADDHSRGIAADTRKQSQRPAQSGTRGGSDRPAAMGDIQKGIVLVAGSLANQEAQEHQTESGLRGAMTYFLIRELTSLQPGDTWGTVMDKVKVRVGANYPNQTPQLETDRPETEPFRGLGERTEPSYLVSNAKNSNGVTGPSMDGGLLQGFTAGAAVELYPPGAKTFESGKGVRATISEAGTSLSWLKPAGGVKIAEGSRAVARDTGPANWKRQLDITNPATKQLVSIRLLGGERTIRNGDCIEIEMKHDFPQPMYLRLVDFDDLAKTIDPVEIFVPGSNHDIPAHKPVVFTTRATVPEGSGISRDFLKLFVTDQPLHVVAKRGTVVKDWGTAILKLSVESTADGKPTNAADSCPVGLK